MASQQNIFHRAKNISENATYASYQVAHLIAKYDKPFSDGEFIKECLIKVEGWVNLQKMDNFNKVSLSRQTTTRRIPEINLFGKSKEITTRKNNETKKHRRK